MMVTYDDILHQRVPWPNAETAWIATYIDGDMTLLTGLVKIVGPIIHQVIELGEDPHIPALADLIGWIVKAKTVEYLKHLLKHAGPEVEEMQRTSGFSIEMITDGDIDWNLLGEVVVLAAVEAHNLAVALEDVESSLDNL